MDLIERAAQKEKKKKEGSGSLVERAAERAASKPSKAQGIGIGSPNKPEQQSDPSSLNPAAQQEEKPKQFRGIGQPGSSRSEAKDSAPEPKKGVGGIGSPEARRSTADRLADKIGDRPLPVQPPSPAEPPRSGELDIPPPPKPEQVGKARRAGSSKRKDQEIDLMALREAGYITPDMPPNLMSEEFRIIKRSILLNAFGKERRVNNGNVVLVTSSNPGEGKSFCAINLALSVATEQDTTVLLIDADFSKPEVLNRLGVSGGRGLMDVVADDEIEIGDCLIRTNIPNLVLLPAGRQHNLTTELLASERMEKIVSEIGSRYPDRLVIFDSPPVLASSAASVLALYMGQTIFVIEAEKTTEPQIKESLSMISACEHINLLLNKTRYSGSNKKFASYYGYGGR
ncbi:XrtA-associated tyrosine autokinase [Kordiimonas lacus]|uniref:non-specific protein-tyrosine kinase n=1 Tax=Kordiimonas lacus TaxID=637679 RepID=A0A1G6W3C9_9PROT|nr:XrtA-associated tyrosine autokinase [Kordiimonas lacus]SDD59737.1 AAA domain-containing protein [Kordiimonas lacus]